MQKILTVFGDENFPKWGSGRSFKQRTKAIDRIIEFFRITGPELVYVIPSLGTNSIIPMVCEQMKIPFIIVSPYSGYCDFSPVIDKLTIAKALEACKSFIVVNEEGPKSAKEMEDSVNESIDLCCKVSSAMVFMYSKNRSKKYEILMDRLCTKPVEHVWELIYDSPKPSRE